MSGTTPPSVSRIADLLGRFRAANVRVVPDGPNLRFWSPTDVPLKLMQAMKAYKVELVAQLRIWDFGEAVRLGEAADACVERSRASGTDPVICAAAEKYSRALFAEDMPLLRLACSDIERRVYELDPSAPAIAVV